MSTLSSQAAVSGSICETVDCLKFLRGAKKCYFWHGQICFDCRPSLDPCSSFKPQSKHVQLLIFLKALSVAQAAGGGGGSSIIPFFMGHWRLSVSVSVSLILYLYLVYLYLFEKFVWFWRRRFLNYSISHGPPERPFELDSVENGTRAPIPPHTYKYGRPVTDKYNTRTYIQQRETSTNIQHTNTYQYRHIHTNTETKYVHIQIQIQYQHIHTNTWDRHKHTTIPYLTEYLHLQLYQIQNTSTCINAFFSKIEHLHQNKCQVNYHSCYAPLRRPYEN